MDTNRLPKQALQYKPNGRRSIERPRKRWRYQIHLEDQGTVNMPNPSGTWWWVILCKIKKRVTRYKIKQHELSEVKFNKRVTECKTKNHELPEVKCNKMSFQMKNSTKRVTICKVEFHFVNCSWNVSVVLHGDGPLRAARRQSDILLIKWC